MGDDLQIASNICVTLSFINCRITIDSRYNCSYLEKVWFYLALYPVHWTAQSALHFPSLADLFIPIPFSVSLGSILAMLQLRNDYSLTFPPLSIVRYSFIQLSRLRRREVKENAQTSKRYQRGFEPGLSRLRVRHSTTEPPRSTCYLVIHILAIIFMTGDCSYSGQCNGLITVANQPTPT